MSQNDTSPVHLSRSQLSEIDRRAVEEYGLSSLVLMENAGRQVADAVCAATHGPVLIVTGKGNNAGDGFVVARHLDLRGIQVTVALLEPDSSLTRDARSNLEVLERAAIPLVDLTEQSYAAATLATALEQACEGASLIVDGLLGTGIQGPAREPYASAIEILNALPQPILAIDLPSGMDCDLGPTDGFCIRAETTVSFVARKKAFQAADAIERAGKIIVGDIGAPRALIDQYLTR